MTTSRCGVRVVACIAFLFAIAHANVLPIHLEQVSSGKRVFVDSAGRQRLFHGVNTVVKGPPWIPSTDVFNVNTSLVDKDFELLRKAGQNVIRLGTMWPGAEPENGQFNETYIEALVNLTRRAAQYGVYSLLDMHQDVLSEKFCGEGAPYWATNVEDAAAFPIPVQADAYADFWDPVLKYPSRRDCSKYSWATYYVTSAAGRAFDQLYTDTPYRYYWARFWAKITRAFKGEPQVLGVELMNEPWAGDVVSDPLLIVPSVADRYRLQPAYDNLSASVWSEDPQRLIFFDSVTWDDFVPVGFTHAPGNNSNYSVFSFHFYEPPQLNLEPYFKTRNQDGVRLQVGLALTEFNGYGYAPTGEQDGDKARPTFDDVADQCDQYQISWMQWEFKPFCTENHTTNYQANITQNDEFGSCKTGYGGYDLWNRDGTENKNSLKHFARTYPIAVAGETVSFSFNVTTGYFQLQFVPKTRIELPTEIYYSEEFHYPNGYEYTVEPKGSLFLARQTVPNTLQFYFTT